MIVVNVVKEERKHYNVTERKYKLDTVMDIKLRYMYKRRKYYKSVLPILIFIATSNEMYYKYVDMFKSAIYVFKDIDYKQFKWAADFEKKAIKTFGFDTILGSYISRRYIDRLIYWAKKKNVEDIKKGVASIFGWSLNKIYHVYIYYKHGLLLLDLNEIIHAVLFHEYIEKHMNKECIDILHSFVNTYNVYKNLLSMFTIDDNPIKVDVDYIENVLKLSPYKLRSF